MKIDKFIKEFGREALLSDGNGWNSELFNCFIQPLRYKNKMYLDGVNTSIGYNSEGHYLYIGPPEHDLTTVRNTSIYLTCDDVKYKVDRAEKVFFGNQVLYIWAIIRTIVEVDT